MADRLKKLAAKNRIADEAEVRAARAALRILRESGVERRQFGLLPPFGGERPPPKGGRRRHAITPKVTEDA